MLAIAVVILVYDQLVFRPIVAWADKFRFEQMAAQRRPQSWVYDLMRAHAPREAVVWPLRWLGVRVALVRWPSAAPSTKTSAAAFAGIMGMSAGRWISAWLGLVAALSAYAAWQIFAYVSATLGPADLLQALGLTGC